MKIRHIRNATMLIETNKHVFLVDPMLSEKGSMPSYTEKRFNPQKNPIVKLPQQTKEQLSKVTHCIITHLHSDHLDKAGEKFLRENKIPVICSTNDAEELKKRGLNIFKIIKYWHQSEFQGVSIDGIPAKHGYGKVAELMGNVMGYFIRYKNKSVYLSSDTIYTAAVDKVLKSFKPDISVLACGSAQLDKHEPILMTMKDILIFIENASGHVIANHMEAVNHCPTTREMLTEALKEKKLSKKVWIPDDGEEKLF